MIILDNSMQMKQAGTQFACTVCVCVCADYVKSLLEEVDSAMFQFFKASECQDFLRRGIDAIRIYIWGLGFRV